MLYRYIGKADPTNQTPYHLLAYHCLDVAAVGRQLLLMGEQELLTDWAELLQVPKPQLLNLLTFLLALHDLGKFSAAFQHLPVFSASEHGLRPSGKSYNATEYRPESLQPSHLIVGERHPGLMAAQACPQKSDQWRQLNLYNL